MVLYDVGVRWQIPDIRVATTESGKEHLDAFEYEGWMMGISSKMIFRFNDQEHGGTIEVSEEDEPIWGDDEFSWGHVKL